METCTLEHAIRLVTTWRGFPLVHAIRFAPHRGVPRDVGLSSLHISTFWDKEYIMVNKTDQVSALREKAILFWKREIKMSEHTSETRLPVGRNLMRENSSLLWKRIEEETIFRWQETLWTNYAWRIFQSQLENTRTWVAEVGTSPSRTFIWEEHMYVGLSFPVLPPW